jgi:hypothetical protein
MKRYWFVVAALLLILWLLPAQQVQAEDPNPELDVPEWAQEGYPPYWDTWVEIESREWPDGTITYDYTIYSSLRGAYDIEVDTTCAGWTGDRYSGFRWVEVNFDRVFIPTEPQQGSEPFVVGPPSFGNWVHAWYVEGLEFTDLKIYPHGQTEPLRTLTVLAPKCAFNIFFYMSIFVLYSFEYLSAILVGSGSLCFLNVFKVISSVVSISHK